MIRGTTDRLALLDSMGLLPRHPAARTLALRLLDRGALRPVDLQTLRDVGCLVPGGALPPDLFVVLAMLAMAVREGSPCLRLDGSPPEGLRGGGRPDAPGDEGVEALWAAAGRRLQAPDDALGGIIRHVGAAEARQDLEEEEHPLLIHAAHGSQRRLYFQRYHRHEMALRRRLVFLARRTSEPRETTATLVAQVREAARYDGFTLADEQLRALHIALRQPFTLITGGPGTGKTTIVGSLLRAHLARGLDPQRIALVAPTGRAGQRLGEALRATLAKAVMPPAERQRLLELDGVTIHRLLRYNPSRDAFQHDAERRLPLDLLVADEVSMIDLVLMSRLMDALPDSCRVVLLGDPDQLPSVDAGCVLSDLLPRDRAISFSPALRQELAVWGGDEASPDEAPPGTDTALRDRVVHLRRSHRNRGMLAAAAVQINRGVLPPDLPRKAFHATPDDADTTHDWSDPPAACVRIDGVDTADPRAVQAVACSWTRFFDRRRALPTPAAAAATEPSEVRQALALLAPFEAGRVLCLLRSGPFGSRAINRALERHWRPRLDPHAPASLPLFHGAPLMILRNAPALGLFNGDVGVAVRDAQGRYSGIFPRSDKIIRCPAGRLPEFETAYAITIHKSQGSQYGQVLIVLPPAADHPLLTREVLFTGITRALGSAFLLAGEAVLQAAVSRRVERQSGLAFWNVD